MEEFLKGRTDEEIKELLTGMFMTSALEKYLKEHHPKLLEK